MKSRSREIGSLSHPFEIWQAHLQQCCRGAYWIVKRSDNCWYKSRSFEISWHLTVRRLIELWNSLGRVWSDRPWWRHQMETFSALLALCAGNSTVTGEFPSQRPVTRSFDVFFDLPMNKRLSKQPRRRWFETPSASLWGHCNDTKPSPEPMLAYGQGDPKMHGNEIWICKISKSHNQMNILILNRANISTWPQRVSWNMKYA